MNAPPGDDGDGGVEVVVGVGVVSVVAAAAGGKMAIMPMNARRTTSTMFRHIVVDGGVVDDARFLLFMFLFIFFFSNSKV